MEVNKERPSADELWELIEREIQFVKDCRLIFGETQNEQELGARITIAFNQMNEKIDE